MPAQVWRDRLAVTKQAGQVRTSGAGHIPCESQMQLLRRRAVPPPIALLQLEPHTGRSHQLRVQCACAGCRSWATRPMATSRATGSSRKERLQATVSALAGDKLRLRVRRAAVSFRGPCAAAGGVRNGAAALTAIGSRSMVAASMSEWMIEFPLAHARGYKISIAGARWRNRCWGITSAGRDAAPRLREISAIIIQKRKTSQ